MTSQDPKKSVFGFEVPEDSPGFLLWQTTITWQRLIKKALDSYEISHPQFVIMAVALWLKEHHQDPTQVSIVRLSKLDKMTVSTSLKKLSLQGYVSRKESEKDTRAKWVNLTPQGKALVSKLIPMVEGIDAEFFGKVSQRDQQSLIQILGNLMAEIHD
ncbi:MAG: MarR family winged helix-turn-helix transcriptional regulator [Alphaproteobacteria bacterium]|nr:MarR family winged helix-turn-helix transcriptional regulator [Alphaproteobacteria bacterium]